MQVQIRDVIRAYDFKPMVGRPDCYIEGEVVDANCSDHGYDSYKIVVTKDHFGDEVSTEAHQDCRVGHTMLVPKNVMFNDYAGRVINLSRI